MAKLVLKSNATITIYLHDEPEIIATKQVREPDGFWTDYTWYRMPDGTHKFIYGDMDIYGPEDEADWECDSYMEAHDWFANYSSLGDEESEDEENTLTHLFGDLEDMLDFLNIG